jgi:Na+/H+ antiporter NhaD/arsenite permease-like protein
MTDEIENNGHFGTCNFDGLWETLFLFIGIFSIITYAISNENYIYRVIELIIGLFFLWVYNYLSKENTGEEK